MHRFTPRKLFASTLATAVLATLSALPFAAQAATTLRFGHVNNNGELATELFQEFADNITKKTKGELTIKVFPGEQLGKEVDLIQQVKSGAVDLSAPSMAALSNLAPALEIASGPFLWRDWAQAQKVITGPAFQPVFDELRDKHGVLMLSKIWYWGWRNLTTGSKPVNKPEDMAGLKIRVPESPVWVEMIKAMGAAATPIPFGEVYTALQMKLVDGQENPIPTIYTRKFYEVQPHLSMTRHMLQNNTVIINKRSLEKLSPEFQKLLFDEIATLSEKNSRIQQEREASMLEEIRKSGKTTINDKPDRAAFAARMEPAYKALEARWGAENLKRIRAAVDAAK
ncbi:TRAP transporter substrate-binding protein [Propionivibrio dicarboxylicus]|uniref:Tripartite ATP-independent transporter solute receptor, DctP family n=1 Tax=Propionivibrio dicarboxylicus TaxID=83767 RepID=A0A1G7V2Z7_9RHOO|nr:TRAP transporter substrate-binding protein [Propionivibrio dicarboxylicus]SDG53739.1 tripartite ATP-independent transporter solute receptor, DctP family [Propionivibrio dicarboxylicus]